MKIKKTLYNWLTNRFLLIIRNEENFAEKRTFSFNYAKLIVFTISFLVITFLLFFYLNQTIFYSFSPEYNETKRKEQLVTLYSRLDSLTDEQRRKELFRHNIHRILTGNVEYYAMEQAKEKEDQTPAKDIKLDSLHAIDIQLRKEFESEQKPGIQAKQKAGKELDFYLVKPAEGIISRKYDHKSGKFGVEIATKSGEIVKSISEGSVILANYSEDGHVIIVQHKNGFISVYKQNKKILKNMGEAVSAGEAIAVSGTSGNTQSKLYFELWKDGNPVNPEHYISF